MNRTRIHLLHSLLVIWLSHFTQAFWVPQQRTRRSSLHAVSKTGGRLLQSEQDYSSAIAQSTRPVLVFWTAPWCGPCRLSIPVVKDVTKQFAQHLDACEICTDDLPACAAAAGVVSVPTIHLYFQGELRDTLVGCVAKQVLAGSVEKVLEDIAAQSGKKKT